MPEGRTSLEGVDGMIMSLVFNPLNLRYLQGYSYLLIINLIAKVLSTSGMVRENKVPGFSFILDRMLNTARTHTHTHKQKNPKNPAQKDVK